MPLVHPPGYATDYYHLYWVHALIRHYLTPGRKYALTEKHVLIKHVHLLTRLYGMSR